ncbi:MAG: tetratricopeptide repeat protein, partial [Planctomycetota bacterium]|nr:tetratricopeptide repeat protein [Planctomycetota bacterium]
AETAYWNPTILTDNDGKAKLTLRLPDQSTAWTLLAQGITRDSQAGQAEAEVVTRKELFAEIRLPLGFTVGDKADVPVEVHHPVAITEQIEVKFKAVFGEKTTEYKRMITADKPGITEIAFPLDIGAGESAEITVTLAAGERQDRVERSVPVLDYGLPVYATASGSSTQNTSFQIQFPAGLTALRPQLELVIGPSIHRGLLDTVLGSTVSLYERRLAQPAADLERAVSDCVGGVAVLKLIGASRTTDSPEAQSLAGKIQVSISRLVSAQRDDGGWSWSGRPTTERSDRYLSSRAVWALSAARKAGFAVPAATFDKGVQHLQSAFASADEGDLEGKAIVLHGLAEAGSADFAHANRLHRSRQSLTASGLVHLALTFQRLDKPEFAQEVLALAKTKIPSKPVAAKGETDVAMRGCIPWMQSGVELRALYLLALSTAEPAAAQNAEVADWLMSTRVGSRWTPEKANAPAIAALAEWFGRGKLLNEKYTLSIFANDRLVEKIAFDPSIEPSRVVAVPAKLLVADKPQKINLDIEGRGTFSYSAVLTGFVPADKIRQTTQEFAFTRVYAPAPRMLDGQEIPRGFSNLTGQVKTFPNPLTQLPIGERGEVSISIWRREVKGVANEQLDYLIYTEPIPAGTVVVPESIQGTFDRYEIVPGAINFYLGDRPHPGAIKFSIAGVLPGSYHCAPSVLRSFYQPERIAVAKDLPLDVLPRGIASKDEYRLTPMEMFEFGKRYVAKGEFDKADEHLQPLFRDYRMTDQYQTELVKMLFQVALARNDHQGIVQFFEIIKEKFPDYEVPFESILKVARSYIQLGEYERGYLVYRATAEASFLRENQIAGFLDGQGEFLRSVQVVERLLREYPPEGYVATATYALAQEIQGKAAEAATQPKLKAAGVTRVDLVVAAVQMLDHFLTNWPSDPAADQVAFAMANAYLELEQYKPAIDRCTKFAERYPESKLLDSFWYVIGFCQFAEGRHEEALVTCKKVAEYKRIDAVTGVEVAAANKNPAIYIMGQVYHSLGKPAEAIVEYERVRDEFPDARESIDFFLHKQISLPEVTTVKPGEPAKTTLKFRNVKGASVKVYRIDLLKFSLLQRNLSKITAINLAGIRPYHEQEVELGNGLDYRDRERELEMPLSDEGAYLVVAQGENLYTSGLVLVSPLVLEIQEDATAGRVRVTVKDTVADRYAHKIHVKVIGSRNEKFISGETDLRGLFVADGILGTSTVIAKIDSNRYAFFRGKQPLGAPEKPVEAAPAAQPPAPNNPGGNSILLKNLNDSNNTWQREQRMKYRNMLENKDSGVKAKKAY